MKHAFDIDNVAKAVGLSEEIIGKWTKHAQVAARKDERGAIFQMNGPIVSDYIHNMMGKPEGLVSPSALLDFLNANKKSDIAIDINTPGGDVHAANAMLAYLMRHEGKIAINVVGAAYSAGSFFLTLKGAHRTAYEHSDVMIHKAHTLAIGNADEIMEVVNNLNRTDEKMAKRYARVSSFDEKEIMQMMSDETFLDAKDALDAGFIDEIVDGEPEPVAEDDDKDDVGEISGKTRSELKAEDVLGHAMKDPDALPLSMQLKDASTKGDS